MTGCVAAELLPACWRVSVASSALLRGKGPGYYALSLWLPPTAGWAPAVRYGSPDSPCHLPNLCLPAASFQSGPPLDSLCAG